MGLLFLFANAMYGQKQKQSKKIKPDSIIFYFEGKKRIEIFRITPKNDTIVFDSFLFHKHMFKQKMILEQMKLDSISKKIKK